MARKKDQKNIINEKITSNTNTNTNIVNVYTEQIQDPNKANITNGGKKQIIGIIGLIIAIVTLVVSFTIPEVRSYIGLGKTIIPSTSESIMLQPLLFAKGVFRVIQGQMIILKTNEGVAAVKFSFYYEGAGYEWRFVDRHSRVETSGSGILYERYARTKMPSGYYEVIDIGSKVDIIAGKIKFTWSYSNSQSGWIYIDDENINEGSIASLDEKYFDIVILEKYF
jgi:hypothetical protein